MPESSGIDYLDSQQGQSSNTISSPSAAALCGIDDTRGPIQDDDILAGEPMLSSPTIKLVPHDTTSPPLLPVHRGSVAQALQRGLEQDPIQHIHSQVPRQMKHRTKWSDRDLKVLHGLIKKYHNRYAEMQKSIERGEVCFEDEHPPNWQAAIRYKARSLARQYRK